MRNLRARVAEPSFEALPTPPVLKDALAGDGSLEIPSGVSPALDLQRHLEASVMRSFYAKADPVRGRGLKRMAVVLACAAISWAGVFGAGYVLLA